jgi:uncharacterized protein YjiK
MKALISILLIFSSISISCSADQLKYKLTIIAEYPLQGFLEPSGLTYSESRNTLFIVGDEGHVAEISLNGDILNKSWLGKRDLEGITIDPDRSALYVLDERKNQILLLDIESLEILDIAALPDKAVGPYEGLSLDEDGSLILVNQITKKKSSKAYILRISKEGDIRRIGTQIMDQSSVSYQKEGLYILSDQTDRMFFFNKEGELQWDCFLPGENQEGLAIDGEGFFYIAQDSGGMLKLKLIRDPVEKAP